jgi:hypothetical protein
LLRNAAILIFAGTRLLPDTVTVLLPPLLLIVALFTVTPVTPGGGVFTVNDNATVLLAGLPFPVVMVNVPV